ncbi:MAG: Na+:solute symporter [Candidatus Omnitrophica bacterium]|nr:Na+:solute symporter [Candidatus Omnitrophota bacterium]
MHWLDWAIVWGFCLVSLLIGVLVSTKAGQSLEAYFVSNRRLGWWLAGTSIAATAFSSDTPLLVTGMVRRRGIWGNWELWALGISTMAAVFIFSRLWKRANVMTEVELVERRYSGRAAAFLRGFKALYWGVCYNCFVMGAWPVVGMTKVLEETTGFSRGPAILASVVIGTAYTSLAGLWGVVLTDAFQFLWAMAGAVLLAVWAVGAVGGVDQLVGRLAPPVAGPVLAVLPPMTTDPQVSWVASPFGWFLGLMLVQWWAWKNADGGGIIVQRLVSCRDERQAMGSVLWFSIAHYCLRSWPWILTALASLVLIPNDQLLVTHNAQTFVDHERAYPRLITMLLPVGLKGVLVASFFAAFLSTISTHLNWGSSYLVNDLYKRFVNRRASERHYVAVSRLIPFGLAAGALWVAWQIRSIGEAFTLILNLTAGIGPVYLLRWCWWRVNPWSEIAAMTASLPVLWLRPHALAWLGLPQGLLIELLFMVAATGLIWIPVTLCTPPVERGVLRHFYAAVRPPGWWKPVAPAIAGGGPGRSEPWGRAVSQWLIASAALLATTIGPLQLLLHEYRWGGFWCAVGCAGWLTVAVRLRGTRAQ